MPPGPFPACCPCPNPSGPFDVYGQLPYWAEAPGGAVYRDDEPWFSRLMPPFEDSFITTAYTNKLARSAMRGYPSIDDSAAAGQFVYAGPNNGRDLAFVSSTLAIRDAANDRDVVWYMRWRNFDNPPVAQPTEYIANSLASWNYDPGVGGWDGVDRAIEAQVDHPPELRTWKTVATAPPDDTLMQFRMLVKAREATLFQVTFSNFRNSHGPLTVQVGLTPGFPSVGPTALFENPDYNIAAEAFEQENGYVLVQIWIRTQGGPAYLATAQIGIGVSGASGLLAGQGLIVQSVDLREIVGSGLDLVCVDATHKQRLARYYLRPDRVVGVAGGGNITEVPDENKHGYITLTGFDQECTPWGHGCWGSWSEHDDPLNTFGGQQRTWVALGNIWCNETTFARFMVANEPNLAYANYDAAVVWTYGVNGVRSVAYKGVQGGIYVMTDDAWDFVPSTIEILPPRDYPNVFGLKFVSDYPHDPDTDWPPATFDVPPEDPYYPFTIEYETPRTITSTASLMHGEPTTRSVGSNRYFNPTASPAGPTYQWLEGPIEELWSFTTVNTFIKGTQTSGVAFLRLLAADSIDGSTVAIILTQRLEYPDPVFHEYAPPEDDGQGGYIFHDPHWEQGEPTTISEAHLLINGAIVETHAITSAGPQDSPFRNVYAHRTESGVRLVVIMRDVATGVHRLRVFSGGTELWSRTQYSPNITTPIDAARASSSHLYVTGLTVCDNRMFTKLPQGDSQIGYFYSFPQSGVSPVNVFSWDGERSWPGQRFGEHYSGPPEIWTDDEAVGYPWPLTSREPTSIHLDPYYQWQDRALPLDVVKGPYTNIPLSPRPDEYPPAECDL